MILRKLSGKADNAPRLGRVRPYEIHEWENRQLTGVHEIKLKLTIGDDARRQGGWKHVLESSDTLPPPAGTHFILFILFHGLMPVATTFRPLRGLYTKSL